MKNIQVVLYNTKKYDAENIDDVQHDGRPHQRKTQMIAAVAAIHKACDGVADFLKETHKKPRSLLDNQIAAAATGLFYAKKTGR